MNIQRKSNCSKRILGALGVVMLSILLFISFFKASFFSFDSALSNIGGDGTSFLSEVKLYLDSGSALHSNLIGGVYGTDRRGTMSFYLFNDVRWISYLFAKVTGSAELAVNLALICAFLLNGLTAYFVLASRKIHPFLAAAGAFLFETQFYVFIRAKEHLMLVMLYTIPLAILLCLWLGEEDNYLRFGKGFFRNRRNRLTILIAFLMVNSGIGYYMFFGSMLIALTGIGKSIRNQRFTELWQTMKIGVMIGTFLVINLLPYLYYHYVMYIPSIGATRGIKYVECYGMKPFRLFFPIYSHMTWMNWRLQQYYETAVYEYETTEYLGIIGWLGFALMVYTLIRREVHRCGESDCRMAALLSAFIIPYATLGGLNVAVYIFVADFARSNNRLSVYLCFLCVLVVGIYGTRLLERWNDRKRRGAVIALMGVGFLLCLKSQMILGPFNNLTSQQMQQEMSSFVAEIESVTPENTLIYELPFQDYPLGEVSNGMAPNAHFLPYLYSHHLRWSYGSFKGEESYAINEQIGTLEGQAFFDALEEYGFGGVYLDTAAYDENDVAALQQMFVEAGYEYPIVSQSGRWLYYAL